MTDQAQQQKLISCRVCGSTDKLRRCSKCKIAFYCSQTHQQSDWRTHKIECRKLSNNNSSSILLETQQSEQNRSKKNIRPSNTSEGTETDDADIKTSLDNSSSSSSKSSGSNVEKKQSMLNEEKKSIEEPPTNLPQHLSKLEKPTEDERENQHQFRNLAENSMRISNDNILSPNMVPR